MPQNLARVVIAVLSNYIYRCFKAAALAVNVPQMNDVQRQMQNYDRRGRSFG